MQAVTVALRAMASGVERCMYCEDSQGCDVEHFRPKVPHPAKTFAWSNLLWVCAICNRQKNDAFDPAIIHPTKDDPNDHFVLSLTTGRLVAREGSPRGQATLMVMKRLGSDQGLTRGRQNAVTKLRTFLARYDVCRTHGDLVAADEIRRVMVEEPFSAVLASVLRASKESGAREVLGDALVDVLARRPEVYNWLEAADLARIGHAQATITELAKRVRVSAAPASR